MWRYRLHCILSHVYRCACGVTLAKTRDSLHSNQHNRHNQHNQHRRAFIPRPFRATLS